MFNQTNTLYVVIDPSGAQSGATAVKNSLNSIQTAAGNVNVAINNIGTATQNMSRTVTANVNTVQNTFNRLSSGIGSAMQIIATMQPIHILDKFISDIQEADRAYNGFLAMMTVTTKSVGASAEEYKYVAAVAREYGVAIQGLMNNYSKLAASTDKLITKDQTKKVFESITMVSSVLHAEQYTVERMFAAITQIASKGQLHMEELKQQLGEHLPGAIAIAATSMHMTIAELMDAMKKGQITAKNFLNTFPQELAKRFGDAAEVSKKSLHAVWSNLKTASFDAFKTMSTNGIALGLSAIIIEITRLIDGSTGHFQHFSQVVGSALMQVADFLKNITSEQVDQFANSVIDTTKAMFLLIGSFADAVSYVSEHSDEFILLAEILGIIGVTVAISLAPAFAVLLPQALLKAAGATGTLTNAFMMLQGTLGLLASFAMGWMFGEYLSKKFVEVELAGAALVVGLNLIPLKIEEQFTRMSYGIQKAFAGAFESAANSVNAFYAWMKNNSGSVLERMGLGEFSKIEPVKLDLTSQYRTELSNEIKDIGMRMAEVKKIGEEMADEIIARHMKKGESDEDLSAKLGLSKAQIENARRQLLAFKDLANEADAEIEKLSPGSGKGKKKKASDMNLGQDANAAKEYEAFYLRTIDLENKLKLEKMELADTNSKLTATEKELTKYFDSDAYKRLPGYIQEAMKARYDQVLADEREIIALRDLNKLLEEGKQIIKDTRTPAEQLNDTITRLNQIRSAGGFAEKEEAYYRAVTEAQDKFDKQTEDSLKKQYEKDAMMKNAMKSMQSTLADFLFDPFEKGISGMLQSFTNMVRKMVAEAISAQIMKHLFGAYASGNGKDGDGLFGSFIGKIGAAIGGAWGSGGSNGFVSSGMTDLGSGLTLDSYPIVDTGFNFAKGGTFNGSTLGSYLNTVQTSPTAFQFNSLSKFAKGGVFAEAGPEAVMPLAQMSDGSLGVKSLGNSGNTSVEIHNYSGMSVKQSEEVDSRGNKKMKFIIGEAAAAETRRPGSPMNNAMRGSFGLRPVLTRR